MEYVEYSHRHADAIIEHDQELKKRYEEFMGAISGISDEEIIADFIKRQEEHAARGTTFKSVTPSINALLKQRMLEIPGWKDEVDIFNDTDTIGNTEWRLDFACDNAFCVEVAFNHGEAIAWNLLKPVLSCELNHVEKAVQGQLGIYVCATDKLKIAGNIDSASGSYEKVLRYIPPLMNQLTIPMMVIGLKPFQSFKISSTAKIVRGNTSIDESFIGRRVMVTDNDFDSYKGTIMDYRSDDDGFSIDLNITRKNTKVFNKYMIKFIECL